MLHEQHRGVAPCHGKSTMRQVDEIHQTQRDRQANRQDEQQHPVGHTIEQQCQHDCAYLVLPGSFMSLMASNSTL